MSASLGWLDAAAMFAAMALLAAVPSTSVAAVVARSASSGFGHGALVALGIVVGDILFALAALLGLVLLVEALDDVLVWVRYVGGAYLLWLGITLLRSRTSPGPGVRTESAGLVSSFLVGLLITLADQKAILFYLGFFPAFVNLERIAPVDIAMITIVAVGGVKLGYAYAAERTASGVASRSGMALRRAAGAVMIAVGVWLIVGMQSLWI